MFTLCSLTLQTDPEEIKKFLYKNKFIQAIYPTKYQNNSTINENNINNLEHVLTLNSYSMFAQLKTLRTSYEYNGVRIDLDHVSPTNYVVGELEIMTLDSIEDISRAREKLNQTASVFGIDLQSTRIQGKVLHYLNHHQPQHYQKLRECGLLHLKGVE